jgi:RyR domain
MKSMAHSIARVCHEVNAAYCAALGDPTQTLWEEAPQWQKDSAIAGVELHLANPNLGVDASHQAWLEHKRAEGWTYGPIKDPEKKEHPCYVPYADLPAEQKAKDFIFRGVVHAIAREMAR